MTLYLHELKRNRLSLIIWSTAISFMLGVCVLIYPEMSGQMNEMSALFSDMGSFTAAFGMDRLNFGEFMGYFGVECGNCLGIGGALFAALTAITALSKEEKNGTAELLLTLPVSRAEIVTGKILAVVTQIVIMNACVAVITLLSVAVIGEEIELGTFMLLILAYLIMQLEVAAITFAISAFIRRGGVGIGLGTALLFYFMNIIANLSEKTEFLKYITPFGYTDSADIITDKALEPTYIVIGIGVALASVVIAYCKYTKKDIL
ncbi:MAG: ABC transporter permease [Ruminococcaceae bacterium]|nr:ABC transporter permease [Oscillospiraceae bacterium]